MLAANSNGITLWNRAMLDDELSLFDGDPAPVGLKRLTSDLRSERGCAYSCGGALHGVLAARHEGTKTGADPRENGSVRNLDREAFAMLLLPAEL